MKKIIIPLIAVIYTAASICNCTMAQETGSLTDDRDGKVYKTVKIGDQWWMGENLAYNTDGGCFTYEDIKDYVDIYGYLYTWETAKNVCPAGWHLPSNSEFVQLANFLGGPDIAGGKLKEAGTDHWTIDELDTDIGAGHALYSGKAEFSLYGLEKEGGFSVRCIKD